MNRPLQFALCFFALLAGAQPALASPPSISTQFGDRVAPHEQLKAPYLSGDFDGDGVPDAVYVVEIAPDSAKKKLAPDVAVVGYQVQAPHLCKQGEGLALAIVQGKTGRKTLVTGCGDDVDGSAFDSPIWTVRPLPLSVAKRGSPAFEDFHKQDKRIVNDVLVLGTEAGIDLALYWNGKAFALFVPNEEP